MSKVTPAVVFSAVDFLYHFCQLIDDPLDRVLSKGLC